MSQPDLREIADQRGGRDITRGRIEHAPYLRPTDDVWREAGGWPAYEALLRDDQVAACFAQRRLAVVRRPWAVDAGGERRIDRTAADLLRETLHDIGWDEVTDQMLYARLFGFAVAEIIWARTPNGIRISAIKPRDRARFVFGADGALKLLTLDEPRGMPLPARKFWVVRVGASHGDEPYGRGLAHALTGPVRLKRHGARFWATFLEKFGAPTVVGKFAAGTSAEDQARLLEAAQAVMTDAGIVLPDGITLELLEASRAGQAGYDTWMRYWDAAIAKVILGQTMTTEDGSSRAQAQVHWDVRQDIVAADADLIDESANLSWVRWLIDHAYPGAAYPRLHRVMDDPEDLSQRAERDVRLAGIGLKLTPEAVRRVYGDDYTLEAAPVPDEMAAQAVPALHATKPSGSAHAQGGEPELEARVPELLSERMEIETEAAWGEIMDRLKVIVEAADSLPALRDALLDAFGDLPQERLAEVMAMGFAAAELAGRVAVEAEADDGG